MTNSNSNSLAEFCKIIDKMGKRNRELSGEYRKLISITEPLIPEQIIKLFDLWDSHKQYLRKAFGYNWGNLETVQETAKNFHQNLDELQKLIKELVPGKKD